LGQTLADPKAEQCGWLKDKFGVSWQVHPVPLEEMMAKGSREQVVRVTQAFLQMKKFDIEKLREACAGGKARGGEGADEAAAVRRRGTRPETIRGEDPTSLTPVP
jgi:3-demethylubiquinone-9 3-methyltransferase